MKSNEISKKLGISYKSLRIYEEKGIVVPERIENNNYREYKKKDIWKLKCVKLLKELGLSLEEIKNMLDENTFSKDNLNKFYYQFRLLEKRLTEISIMKDTIGIGLNTLLREKDNIDSIEKFFKTIIRMEKVLEEKKKEQEEKINEWKSWKFDEVAFNYVESYFKNDVEYIKGIKLLQERVKMEPDRIKVLDIGCGTSEYWKEIYSKINLYGFDSSLNMLILSKENIPNLNVYYGDITNYNEIKNFIKLYGKMDLITMCYTLHHIEYDEQMETLKNILEILKNGKKIILIDRMFENEIDKIEKLGKMDKKLAEIINSEFYCYVDEIKEFLDKYALNYIYEHIIDHLWYFEIKNF